MQGVLIQYPVLLTKKIFTQSKWIKTVVDNQPRFFLIIALALVIFLIWQAWIEEQMAKNAPPPGTQPATTSSNDTPNVADTPPAVGPDPAPGRDLSDVPSVAPSGVVTAAAEQPAASGDRVRVETDQLIVEIDTQGGSIVYAGLRNYPKSLGQKDNPFVLLNDRGPELFIAQVGLASSSSPAPDHHQKFSAGQSEYRLQTGQDTLEVPLTWTDETGVKVTKTYTFHRDSFVVDVAQQIENGSAEPWQGRQYRQLQRRASNQSMGLGAVYTYTGGVISTPEKNYEKIDFDDMAESDLSLEVPGGWIAMIQHYFIGTWVPEANEINNFYTIAVSDNRYILGMASAMQRVQPGASTTFTSRLYIGPKIQDRLEALAPNLGRTVDYGWLWFIAEPLFIALKWIHSVVGNWGWSIIILTFLIKLVFYKLSETSYRSMANMRKMAPQMQKLKERYGSDRQKLNQAMMEMYKKEKINPLGGCLPILVQIPVFIALYWMLLESVELRQAPWIGWIKDLATKDPYYILPIIMGASMFIQQRLNPTPPDPIQAKVMMALPFVFTVFFLWFPAGLVLYWVVNNILSIAQQYVITKRVEAGTDKS